MFFPPYIPDLNPIEMAFLKLKAYSRKVKAQTIETLWKTIGNISDLYTPNSTHPKSDGNTSMPQDIAYNSKSNALGTGSINLCF